MKHVFLIRGLIRALRESRAEADAFRKEIGGLKAELDDANWAAEAANERAGKARREADRAERAQRDAEDNARSRQYEIEDAVRDLKRAQSYGDEWGIAKAQKKLDRATW